MHLQLFIFPPTSYNSDEGAQEVQPTDGGGLLIQTLWECFRCYDADKQKRIVNTCYAAFLSNRRSMPDRMRKMGQMTHVIVLGPLLFGTDPVDPFVATTLQAKGIVKSTQRHCPANFGRDVFALCRIVSAIVEKLEAIIVEDGQVLHHLVEVLMERAFVEEPVLFGTSDFIDDFSRRQTKDDDFLLDHEKKARLPPDQRLQWVEKLTELVFSFIRQEPWFDRTDVISAVQMNNLIFVVGKSYAFLILLNVRWISEADWDLYEGMLVRGVTHRQAILFKERGNAYFEQCQNNPEVGSAFRKKMKWFIPISIYSQGIDTAPHSAVLYCNRAKCYLNLNMYEEALADALRAAVLEPTWAKAYFRVGEALYHLGRYSDALLVNERARHKCQLDTKTNKEKDLESLQEQPKTWTKREQEYGQGGGSKSWWDCSPRESVKKKTVESIEYKMNFALDVWKELLEDSEVLSLESAQTLWQSNAALLQKVAKYPMREACTFAEAHEFITIDARSRIALFMNNKKQSFVSLPERMDKIGEEWGDICWVNRLSSSELEMSAAEVRQVDAKLAQAYRREERFLLESHIADKNSRNYELTEQLKALEVDRMTAEKKATIIEGLLRAMEAQLGTAPLPDFECKSQLGHNLREARRAAMGPLILSLNEAFARIAEKEKEVELLKMKLAASEAKRLGVVEEDDDNKKKNEKCHNCKTLLEENKKFKEKEAKFDETMAQLLEEWKKVQIQSQQCKQKEAKIAACEQSREHVAQMERKVVEFCEELERMQNEMDKMRALADENIRRAESREVEVELRLGEVEIKRKEVEKVMAAKRKLEEELKRKDAAIERCTRENMILREKLEAEMQQEMTTLKMKFRETSRELEQYSRENQDLREDQRASRQKTAHNLANLESICVTLQGSTQKALTAYENDVAHFGEWLEELVGRSVGLTTDKVAALNGEKAASWERLKFVRQTRADQDAYVSQLRRGIKENNVAALQPRRDAAAAPPKGRIRFEEVLRIFAELQAQGMTRSGGAPVMTTMASVRSSRDSPASVDSSASTESGESGVGHGVVIGGDSSAIGGGVAKPAKKAVKGFSDIMQELVKNYPQIPPAVISAEFRKYRKENEKLSGKSIGVILSDLTKRLDEMLRRLNVEQIRHNGRR